MPKLTEDPYPLTKFRVPYDLVFGHVPQASVLAAAPAGGDSTTCSLGRQRTELPLCLLHEMLAELRRQLCLFNSLYSVKVSLLI